MEREKREARGGEVRRRERRDIITPESADGESRDVANGAQVPAGNKPS